jgi:non-canonical purine NTP pyrophosphatase (RdgB/HAM1 family)
MKTTFVTGNQDKVDFLKKYLELDIDCEKVELDELQSLDLHKIVDHKVRQAYEAINKPVLVEDVGLSFSSMGNLPGTLVKWFLQEVGNEGLCRLAGLSEDRSATASITYGYFDGKTVKLFDGEVKGSIADRPRGTGFGWDPIFIPDGSDKTNAEMSESEIQQFGLRVTTVFPQLKEFFKHFSG